MGSGTKRLSRLLQGYQRQHMFILFNGFSISLFYYFILLFV